MSHVATITIDHTKVPGDLTDYVGLIVPDGSAGYSALYALCLEGGGDIRLFKSDDITELAREIVTFSVIAETGEIHYKYSGTLSSSVDTAIHVYADGSSADYAVTATYGRNNVWSGWVAVWHMQSASGTRIDSTANGNDLTDNNTVGSALGKIGTAADLERSNSEYFDITDAGQTGLDLQLNGGDHSFMMWIKPESLPSALGGAMSLISKDKVSGGEDRSYLFEYHNSENKLRHLYFNSSGSLTRNQYATALAVGTNYHVVSTVDVSAKVFVGYINGATNSSSNLNTAATSLKDSAVSFEIGTRTNATGDSNFDGLLDEVRVKNSIISSNDAIATYNNQNSYSTFYSVAAVESSTDYPITAAAGTFALSGVAVTTSWARTIAAAVATFTQTGIALIFARGKGFVATAATFGLSGNAAIFAKAISMVTAAGTFALTGIDSIGRKTKLLIAAAATFVLTNVDASVSHVRTMAAAAGTFALTGVASTAVRAVTLLAAAGTFILSTSITSLLGKVWTRSSRNGGTWERMSRSVGEWVRGNKNNDS